MARIPASRSSSRSGPTTIPSRPTATPSSDALAIFRYRMHTLPDEVSGPIGTSTLFAAWNAAIYVAQIEDDRLSEVVRDGRYLEATDRVLKKHGGLWFNDETYVISRRRAPA